MEFEFSRLGIGFHVCCSSATGNWDNVLALMQEFFEQQVGVTNSPAMMKALLINGARSAGSLYDFEVQNTINYQGWGLPKLNNSKPPRVARLVKPQVPPAKP